MTPKRALRVWQRHLSVYRKIYKSSLVLNFFEPVFALFAMGYGLGAFVSNIGGIPYIEFIAPGFIAQSSLYAAAFECTYGTYIRMTYQKTFDAILATPVNLDDLVMGELLWGATKSLIYGSIIMLVITLFGLVKSPLILLSVPFVFVAGLVFAEISVTFVSIAPAIESFNYFFTLFMTPVFLFSGIFFPISSMPEVFQKIVFLNPMYHLVNITRGLGSGQWEGVGSAMLWLVAAAVVLMPLPFKLMKRRMIK